VVPAERPFLGSAKSRKSFSRASPDHCFFRSSLPRPLRHRKLKSVLSIARGLLHDYTCTFCTGIPSSHESATQRKERSRRQATKKYLWPSVTNYFPAAASGRPRRKCNIFGTWEGNKYLDFFGGILTVSVGATATRKISSKSERARSTGCSTLQLFIPPNTSWAVGGKDCADYTWELAAEFLYQFRHGSQRSRHPAGRACPTGSFRRGSRCATPIPAGSSLAKACHCGTRLIAKAGRHQRGEFSQCRESLLLSLPAALEISRLRSWPVRETWKNLIQNRHQRQHRGVHRRNPFKASVDSSRRRRSISRLFSIS